MKNMKNNLKWRCQRFIRGYADVDIWNINIWFLDIMPKMLRQLQKDKQGYPINMTEEEWEKVLDEMINCLSEANENTCSKLNKYKEDFDKILSDKHSNLPVDDKKYKQIKDEFVEEELKIDYYRYKKLQRGLELFCKYFSNLWD